MLQNFKKIRIKCFLSSLCTLEVADEEVCRRFPLAYKNEVVRPIKCQMKQKRLHAYYIEADFFSSDKQMLMRCKVFPWY